MSYPGSSVLINDHATAGAPSHQPSSRWASQTSPVSTAFYQRASASRISSASVPGIVSFFRTAGGLLGLYGAADLAADAQLPKLHPSARLRRHQPRHQRVGSRDEVDAASWPAWSGRRRPKVLKPPQATDWGGYHGYFADPDGHAWEVAHNPGWPLNEAGLPQLPGSSELRLAHLGRSGMTLPSGT